jgi:ABC-type multidrug transport system fused ATPase/permease subunit
MSRYLNTHKSLDKRPTYDDRPAYDDHCPSDHDTERLRKLIDRFGQFWGLYLFGIKTIKDLQWSMMQQIISFLIGIFISMMMTQITIKKDIENDKESVNNMMIVSFGFYMAKQIKSDIYFQFEEKVLDERIKISENITLFVDMLYRSASHKWISKNPNRSQHESLREIFYAFDSMTMIRTDALSSSISAIIMIFIGFSCHHVIGIVIILGTVGIYCFKKRFGKQLEECDKKISKKSEKINISISKKSTNRADIHYSPGFKKLLRFNDSTPSSDLAKLCKIWNERNMMSTRQVMMTHRIQYILEFLLCIYLWQIEKSNLIVFVVTNSLNLFGFISAIQRFETVRNIGGARLTSSFTMINQILNKIDTIDDESQDPEIEDTEHFQPSSKFEPHQMFKHDYDSIESIEIHGIDYNPTSQIRLYYPDIIKIQPKKGFILLDGSKGSGKSLTIDMFAGLYDGSITKGFFINGVQIKQEFKYLNTQISYIRQCVVDDYKNNKKGTITNTLRELFPSGSYEKIEKYLQDFDLAHKMPQGMDCMFSRNERGLSPGEAQAIVLASQIWKAKLLGSQILLLDEPERNIDEKTFDRIFKEHILTFPGMKILVTHSNELKKKISPHLLQLWEYEKNTGCDLVFKIHTY